MATTAGNIPAARSHGVAKSGLILVGAAVLFFVLTDVVKYFLWSEETYGYYWQFRLPLLLHVVGGLVALVTGVFQLWSGIFVKGMPIHPWTGRLYVVGITAGAIGGFILAVSSGVYGIAWSVALIVLALAWLTTTGVAVRGIRHRNVKAHKQWMIRSYIVTFGFVSFRIFTDYVPYEQFWDMTRAEMANAAIWPVWVVPLLIYQVWLELKDA